MSKKLNIRTIGGKSYLGQCLEASLGTLGWKKGRNLVSVSGVNQPSGIAQGYLTSYWPGLCSSVQEMSQLEAGWAWCPLVQPTSWWTRNTRYAGQHSEEQHMLPVTLARMQGSLPGWGQVCLQLPVRRMHCCPHFRLQGRGKNTACCGCGQGASDKASGELCSEGSKLPSKTRMRTSVCARSADRMEKPVIYDFMQYQTSPALPPPMAKEEVKTSKKHIWYTCSVPDLIFACWWAFCNVFIIAIIILK